MKPLAERFWSKVEKTDGCWLWRCARSNYGYGRFAFEGKNGHAHRVAWLLVKGTIPPGMYVLHKCDNPPCCNPDHLFLGTHLDNIADRCAKGRTKVGTGDRHALAKLTSHKAALIKQRIAECNYRGIGVALAKEFGVSVRIISFLKCGKTWRHVKI